LITLLLVEFGGPVRGRLIAYLCLTLVGAAAIAVGTLCSGSAWVAAPTTAVAAFAVLFSGLAGGYVAAGDTPRRGRRL